ncbi:SRPBCC family protein [Cardiobacteriaceae bacterium TAE3-ERU3]|nr:SRPBCC family protein [Cardiobacteriaceae bacterium TAE3-ERU3]
MRMVRGSAIFAHFTGNWRFDGIDDKCSKVTFNYDLAANPRWLSWLLTPIIAAAFRRTTQKRLDGLKVYIDGQLTKKQIHSEKHNI